MIATYIGNRLLKAYNEAYNKSFRAETFFDQVFYPAIMDDPKRGLHVINSPFVNGIRKGTAISREKQQELLAYLKQEIKDSLFLVCNLAPGYPAKSLYATTSGQASFSRHQYSQEDAYAAWSGMGVAIGCNGGMNMMLCHDDLLLRLQKGWKLYRILLDSEESLKGNQMEAWNGVYLMLSLENPEDPLQGIEKYIQKSKTGSKLISVNYFKLMVSISEQYPDMMGYIYKYSQMNTTGGIIPFHFSSLKEFKRAAEEVSAELSLDFNDSMLEVGGSLIQIAIAGEMSANQILERTKIKYKEGKEAIKLSDTAKSIQQFITSKALLMIVTMEDQKQMADKLAGKLLKYELGSTRAKTDRSNQVKKVWATRNQKNFTRYLTDILMTTGEQDLKEIIDKVNEMPRNTFLNFMALANLGYVGKLYKTKNKQK